MGYGQRLKFGENNNSGRAWISETGAPRRRGAHRLPRHGMKRARCALTDLLSELLPVTGISHVPAERPFLACGLNLGRLHCSV